MRAVFLDRDGVVNRSRPEGTYVQTVTDFEVLPGVPEAIAELGRCGYEVFIATNQRCVGRGIISLSDLLAIHASMLDAVEKCGGTIRRIYVCPHEMNQCDCRKPKPGMLLQAQREYHIDLRSSWMVGDSSSDIMAGKRAGCRTALVGPRQMPPDLADIRVPSLSELVFAIKRFHD